MSAYGTPRKLTTVVAEAAAPEVAAVEDEVEGEESGAGEQKPSTRLPHTRETIAVAAIGGGAPKVARKNGGGRDRRPPMKRRARSRPDRATRCCPRTTPLIAMERQSALGSNVQFKLSGFSFLNYFPLSVRGKSQRCSTRFWKLQSTVLRPSFVTRCSSVLLVVSFYLAVSSSR
jgi:hypothetical protein